MCRKRVGRYPFRRSRPSGTKTPDTRGSERCRGTCPVFNEFVPERVAIGRMSERTAQEYGKQAQCYVGPALSNLRVAGVSRRDVERMVKPMPGPTRNRVLAFTSRLFSLLKHGNGDHRTLIR